MKFHLTLISSNRKVGPIPVSTSPQKTCPQNCKFKGKGCYAEGGPIKMHWDKVSSGERGEEYKTFLETIRNLPAKQIWRHNQAGDLCGSKNKINYKALADLIKANIGKQGFTYTHYPVIGQSKVAEHNRQCISIANAEGFTINLSADNLEQADLFANLNVGPITVTLPANTPLKSLKTPEGRTVIICPAVINKSMTCSKCRICSKRDRKTIVSFPAHGFRKGMIK